MCLGGGFVQYSWVIGRVDNPFLLPFWMSAGYGRLILGMLSLFSLGIEIGLGIVRVGLWKGLIIWLPAFIVAKLVLDITTKLSWGITGSFLIGLAFFIVFFLLLI